MAREIVKKYPVRFIMKNAPYNIGEIAGFPLEVSQRFVDRKRAVWYKPPGQEDAEAPIASPSPEPKEESVVEVAQVAEVDAEADAEADAEPEGPGLIVPKRIGGPYYMVGDRKVKGKKLAQEIADGLNATATGTS